MFFQRVCFQAPKTIQADLFQDAIKEYAAQRSGYACQLLLKPAVAQTPFPTPAPVAAFMPFHSTLPDEACRCPSYRHMQGCAEACMLAGTACHINCSLAGATRIWLFWLASLVTACGTCSFATGKVLARGGFGVQEPIACTTHTQKNDEVHTIAIG